MPGRDHALVSATSSPITYPILEFTMAIRPEPQRLIGAYP